MKELFSTNDITKFVYAETILNSNDIVSFTLDENISVLEGSIGILPRRLMVLENDYEQRESFISNSILRSDESLVTSLSLSGQINQILPFIRRINSDNSIFYSFNLKNSDVSSNIVNYDVERNFFTVSLTKRLNLNVVK